MKISSAVFLLFLAGMGMAAENSNLRRLNLGIGNGSDNGDGLGNDKGKDNGGNGGENQEEDRLSYVHLTKEEARAADIEIIAEQFGWTRAEVESHMKLQDEFSQLVVSVKDDASFAGAILPEDLGGSPQLLFKNGIPASVEDAIKGFEGRNAVTVERVTTKFSIQDQRDRGKRLVSHLEAKGFKNVGFAVIGEELVLSGNKPAGNDSIKVTPPGRVMAAGKMDEVAMNMLGLQPGYDDSHQMRFDIYEPDEVLDEPMQTRGGRKICSFWGGLLGICCRGAFTVRQTSTGDTGLLSAGHCSSAIRYDAEPPIDDYPVSLGATHNGEWGDWSVYTTEGTELPEYWASPTDLRDVTGYDAYPIENELVCMYSRLWGKRICDRIYSTEVQTGQGSHLVAVYGANTIPGDSGGPWSFSTTAYGITSGNTKRLGGLLGRDTFSHLAYMNNALPYGLELLTV